MKFKTFGNRNDPAVLFFHAMGVTGESSEPVANYLQDRYFCILPTSTVYCKGQKYVSKADEVRQVEEYLKSQGVEHLELVVASSIGADLAMAFLTSTKLSIGHVFFDGGQFAQIGKGTRRMMTPFLYLAIKSLYWSKGGTLKKILWCDDDSIKPYFIAAGRKSDLYKFAAAYSGQPGGQALSVPSRRTAKASLFRVWQHRRSFQIPSSGDRSLSLRQLPRI